MQSAQYPYQQQQQQQVRSSTANQQVSISTQKLTNQQVTPIDIVFRDLVYSVTVKDEKEKLCQNLPKIKKEILKGVTGII